MCGPVRPAAHPPALPEFYKEYPADKEKNAINSTQKNKSGVKEISPELRNGNVDKVNCVAQW